MLLSAVLALCTLACKFTDDPRRGTVSSASIHTHDTFIKQLRQVSVVLGAFKSPTYKKMEEKSLTPRDLQSLGGIFQTWQEQSVLFLLLIAKPKIKQKEIESFPLPNTALSYLVILHSPCKLLTSVREDSYYQYVLFQKLTFLRNTELSQPRVAVLSAFSRRAGSLSRKND